MEVLFTGLKWSRVQSAPIERENKEQTLMTKKTKKKNEQCEGETRRSK